MLNENQMTLKYLVKTRVDYQHIRKAMDNRLGRKADGESQDVDERNWFGEDLAMFNDISKTNRNEEARIEEMLANVLGRFPIYTEIIRKDPRYKGIKTIGGGYILGWFDIERAVTASQMTQFAGFNPGMVRGRKYIEVKKYKKEMGDIVTKIKAEGNKKARYIVLTYEMVRGDRCTPGFLAPFCKELRTALIGIVATRIIQSQGFYAMEYYYPYKERLKNEENIVDGGAKSWKDESDGHRDNAARRYMIKKLLQDVYADWRDIEGLTVRPPYQEQYLGHTHHDKNERQPEMHA